MRHLNEIECFVKAVELKSLTAAAKALKLPKSNISRKIKNLEERVGMTPLTRASHLTEAGRLYFEKAALALKDLAVAEEMPCVTAKSRRRSISIRRKTATKRAAQGEFLSAVGINATIN